MPSPVPATRRTLRLLLLAAALVFAIPAVSGTAQADVTTTVSAEPLAPATTGSTAGSPVGPTTVTSGQAGQPASAGVVPPAVGQAPLNPGWKIDQMQVQVLPEFDQKAVLVVMNFSLSADVSLPATLKLPIPSGAAIAGIGEIDPNGQFKYNYANSYPPVQAGPQWDVATIEVKDYRDLQIDYYYDPGLPAGAGKRSFPLLLQIPLDVGTFILHVQQPARATDFQIQPALQGSGQADDGYTYEVAAYSDVKAGSTLAHVIAYSKPDGGLSVDSGQSGSSSRVSMTAALLGVALFVVVVAAAVVIYLLYARSRKGSRKPGPAKAQRGSAAAPSSSAASQASGRQRAGQKPQRAVSQKAANSKAAKSAAPPASVEADEGPGRARTSGAGSDEGDEAEYCTVCGEELTPRFRYCPNCGEPRP